MSSSQRTRRDTFTASDVQANFMADTSKQVLAYGGFGGGKTRACCEKGYKLNMQYPGNRGLIVRSHQSDVAKSTVAQCLLEDVIPESHMPEGPEGHNKSANVIKHFTGATGPYGKPITSEIHYSGLSSEGAGSGDGLPRKISGTQFGWIFVDEATEIDKAQWVQLLGRLRYDGTVIKGKKYTVPFRQIMAATNPAGPSHWLYQKFWVDEDGSKYHMKAEDNPGVPQDYVDDMKANYSGVYYERYVEGRWVGTSDAIYDSFDRRENVKDLETLHELDSGWEESWVYDKTAGMAKPPDSWEVFRTIDFGYPSPMVVQWWARSPPDDNGNRAYVMFREFYKSEVLIEDVADKIQAWSMDLDITQTFADPAQANDREELRRYGVSSTAAVKDVWNGIQRVKSQMGKEYDGLPGIMFYEDALINEVDEELEEDGKPARTVDEIGSYEWKNGDSDQPEKEDDHGMDAMRYVIYSLQHDRSMNQDEMEEMENMFNSGGF